MLINEACDDHVAAEAVENTGHAEGHGVILGAKEF